MDYKYDAFISYRHLTQDKAVAERLQVLLEAYKPPHGGQYSNTNRIKRIFRDESELPTSGDLGADITAALETSRFLIVICSEETKNSKWCMQEIKQFKKLHNGSCANILPLLINGEPEESFPDSLRCETRAVTEADGGITTREVEIEPLAADIRAETIKEMKKHLSIEFLRIAAPILGCSYDELYKRHHKRFVRRVIQYVSTFIAVIVLVSGYVIYSQHQITERDRLAAEQKNIAQNERTMRMLKVAEDLIESGDKVLGSALLLELADDMQNSAEYKSKIERLLLWSTYVPQFDCYTYLVHDDIVACLDINNGILISYTQNGTISFWNVANGESLGEIDVPVQIAAMVYENNLLYTVNENMSVITWDLEKWEKSDEFFWSSESEWPFMDFPYDIMLYNNILYLSIPNSEVFIHAINLDTKKAETLYNSVSFIQSFFDKNNKIIYGNTGDDFYVHDLTNNTIDRFPALGRSLFELNDEISVYDTSMLPSKFRISEEYALIAGAEDNLIVLFSLEDAAIERLISEMPESIYGTHTRENGLDETGNLNKIQGGLSTFYDDNRGYKTEAVSSDGKYAIVEIETNEKPLYTAKNISRLYDSTVSYYSYWVADCLTGERLYNANIPMDFMAIDIKDDTIASILTNSCFVHDVNMKNGEIISSTKLSAFSLSGENTPFIMKFRIDYEKNIILVASLFQDRMTNGGCVWSKSSGDKLLDFSDTYNERYLGFDRTASRIYKYRLDDLDQTYDILELEIPNYETLLELARAQVAGRTASAEEKKRLGLD